MIAAGHTADEVQKLPVPQVVLWGMITDYRRLRDEAFKWYYVPYWQHGEEPERASDDIHDAYQAMYGHPFTSLISAPKQ